MKQYGVIIGKILQLLATGYMLAWIRDKKLRKEFSAECDIIWYSIDRKELNYALSRLRLGKFIDLIKEGDNTEKVRLTNQGKIKALQYQLQNIKLKEAKKWDGKWQIVLFDIPENLKKSRDALRRLLKKTGFIEFQKSVFIYPHPCRNEINFIINFFNIYDYVYYIEAPISPDHKFRIHFKLK